MIQSTSINKIKNTLFAVSLVLQCTVVGAQNSIVNNMTTNHVTVSGSKVSLIPPKGFTNAQNFGGFQQEENASSIMVMEFPSPFLAISKGMNKEGLLSKGIILKSTEEYILNGKKAVLLTAEQNAYGQTFSKIVFMFGTEQETIMINGAFPKDLVELGSEIKSAILTTVYEENKETNPLEAVDFAVNTDGTSLIFAKSMSKTLLYNTDGMIPSKSKNTTNLIIGKALSNVEVKDTKLYAINRLKKMPFDLVKIESTNTITIDAISGYEIIASAKDKDTGLEEKVYQVMLFSANSYYLFTGSTNNNYEKNINELKKVVRTFKRK